MNRFLVLLVFCVSSAASAVVIRHDVEDAKYQVAATEFPALADMPGEAHGVLIAPQWVVTAAHTIPHGALEAITLNGMERKVERVIVHPGYRELTQPVIARALESGDITEATHLLASSADIALIRLVEPVTDVAPATLYRGKDEVGEVAKLVGKGATGTGVDGLGPHSPHRTALRRAFNTISRADERWLGYVFDQGAAAHALEGALGDGDSGGPVLIEVDGGWQVAGLGAWKLVEGDLKAFRTGRYGQTSFNVRLSSYAGWIDSVMSPAQPVGSIGRSDANRPDGLMGAASGPTDPAVVQ